MSVASVAQLLQSSNLIYTNYKLDIDSDKKNVGSSLILFRGQIIPPAGIYLISTNIRFEGFATNGTLENILTANVAITYNQSIPISINNLTLETYINTTTFSVQTSGVFVSNGISEIVVSGSVLELESAGGQFTILSNDSLLPQVQLIKLI
jgi:hypothetical protein